MFVAHGGTRKVNIPNINIREGSKVMGVPVDDVDSAAKAAEQ